MKIAQRFFSDSRSSGRKEGGSRRKGFGPKGGDWGLLWFLYIVWMPMNAFALPLISEVLYDDQGSDDASVFVEISAEAGLDLDGFFLQEVNGNGGGLGPVIALRGLVPADGLFVVADATGSGFSKWEEEADLLLNFDFQNGPDSIRLMEGTVVRDALGYGTFDVDKVFAGEGTPAVDPPAGWSVARRWADRDTQDNGADFLALEEPSPGVAPWHSVPEPGSGLLAGFALGALAWWWRSGLSQASERKRLAQTGAQAIRCKKVSSERPL